MLNYGRLPSWTHQRLHADPCAFFVLFSLTLKRDTATNETHPLSIGQIAQLNDISKRHAYRCIEKLLRIGLIRIARHGSGIWVFDLVCLHKNMSIVDFGGSDEHEDGETIQSFLRRQHSGQQDDSA